MFTLENKITMLAASFYIPKKSPEDAHFFSHAAQVIAVADGVDGSEYAQQLMRSAAACIKGIKGGAAVDPRKVLAAAFAKTAALGSSTACIISLAGDGRLRAAVVGDSGFAVIRRGRTVYRSPAQRFALDTPRQVGPVSGGPEQAAAVEVAVEACDIVIAGTDGLFDNLFPEEVEAVVERCLRARMNPRRMARELALAARAKFVMGGLSTPYEVAAREAGVGHVGGKRDDITVVVAYVTSPRYSFCCK